MQAYIHIPFCESKCSYCRFASIWNTQEIQIKRYQKYLIQEIKTSNYSGKPLSTIYFGGWTPTTCSIEQIWEIIQSLKNKFWFKKNIEITLEATPGSITAEYIAGVTRHGVNRISMWLQTLNTHALKEIGREDKWDIFTALKILSDSAIQNISVDFIIGLPYVSEWEIADNITTLLTQFPTITHVSSYMLEEYYDPWEKLWDDSDSKYDQVTYPDTWKNTGIEEDLYQSEYISVCQALKKQWFEKYEISNFSRAGYECQHNQWYWNHSNIAAFWLAASGYINGTRYTNSDDFQKYYARQDIYSELLSSDDLRIERIMFGLRTTGVDTEDISDISELQEYIDNHSLKKIDDKYLLTDLGVVYLDQIIQQCI